MNQAEEWILENRSKIDKGLEILGQSCEVLASCMGEFNPMLETFFRTSAQILGYPDSKEAMYVTEQFEKINQKLDDIKNEMNDTNLQLQRSSMNKQNFDREANIKTQYDYFLKFVKANPKSKETKKQQFLSQYENTNGHWNIDDLYDAVIGDNTSGEPMLETVVKIEQRSRRAVEVFCAKLKMLFVMGIIAVMGHAALEKRDLRSAKEWPGCMLEVEKRMKAAVDECIKNFPKQAEEDVECQLLKRKDTDESKLTEFILDILAKKYYWVSWSVQVFKISEMFIWNWLAGKKYEGKAGGGNFIDLIYQNNIKCVLSFSLDPKPVNKELLLLQIETQKIKNDMESAAQSLCNSLPNMVVHAISRFKNVEEKNNFQPECYFFLKTKKGYFCIHSK